MIFSFNASEADAANETRRKPTRLKNMRVVSLQSGSNGNCIFVEANGLRLLFDAGLTGAKTEERLAEVGVDVRSVHGVLISHDHSDHVKGAGVLQRKFDLPIWLTRKTCEAAAANKRHPVHLESPSLFTAGKTISFPNGVLVETIPTPHDAVDGAGFVVDDGSNRFGILTDLGHVFPELEQVFPTLDGVLLESNYDPKMLEENDNYPTWLKNRIRGKHGHLSNRDAASLIKNAGTRLRVACLGHLSEENNTPELAEEPYRSKSFCQRKRSIPIRIASRDRCVELWSSAERPVSLFDYQDVG